MGHTLLNQIIQNNFPQSGLTLAFGYGSKVVKQSNNRTSDLVDLILVVDDAREWHQENLNRNNSHYSGVKYLSDTALTISKLQENYGAKIYYNPYVDIDDISLKYGVIKTIDLVDDLKNWSNLYVAGRLHKPVEFFLNQSDKNEDLRSALRFNKESAIRASLLQLPESFKPYQLYEKIANLSYQGDFRMLFGEDKNKVENIVTSQIDRFEQLYLPVIRMTQVFKDSVQWQEGKRTFVQDSSPINVHKNLKLLPMNLRRRICEIHGRDARSIECDVVLSSLAKSINYDMIVGAAIASIVRRSSLTQSIKGLITAGLSKSIRYTQRKLIKSISSRVRLSS